MILKAKPHVYTDELSGESIPVIHYKPVEDPDSIFIEVRLPNSMSREATLAQDSNKFCLIHDSVLKLDNVEAISANIVQDLYDLAKSELPEEIPF